MLPNLTLVYGAIFCNTSTEGGWLPPLPRFSLLRIHEDMYESPLYIDTKKVAEALHLTSQ